MSLTTAPRTTQTPLVEGVDYYFDAGLMVLTAHYLRRRGYCCANECRHCPYDKTPDEANDVIVSETRLDAHV
ncbi:MAG: DUF5522 domain-containing protein [Pyrinomonadaceae bacterium MAG19_C2-C3]|nr:DUF5522 domain-containing protein [Pyrinomonadaceae bacterium MAG19_C2-C3]